MSKIKLSKSEVDLQLSSSKDIGKTFKVDFFVNLYPKNKDLDPTKKLTMRDIDEKSFKEALFAHFSPNDKDFVELASFDTTKATFHLKTDKWIKAATKGMVGKKDIKTFIITFKLQEKLPSVLKKDILSKDLEDFVARKIKNWVSESEKREQRLLNIIFPKRVLDKIKRRLYNMFDWEYDIRLNKVEAKLKSIWVSTLMYATIELVRREELRPANKPNPSKFFSIRVRKNLDSKKKRRKKKA